MSSNTASIDNNLGMIASSDYKLNTLQLVTSDGQVVDIRGLVVELNLYEDIFSPVMTGSVTLGDALDLISSLGLHGNEFLQLDVDKPSLNNPIVKSFRLYKIGNRSMGANGLQNYTMYFCSEELIISSENLVSKSYKGLRVDQMVQDLLLKKLRVDPKKIVQIEQTSGTFDFIIPRMNAFEAISWLVPRGYGMNKNLFFFFENRDGFNFVSYESLLTAPTYQTYGYNIKLGQDPVLNSNTFNVINITQDFDMIKAIRAGAFSSTLATFDIFNRQYSAVNFNAQSLANNAILNVGLPANDFQNRFSQSVYQTDGNMLKFVISADSDPTVNPLNIRKWLPQTASRLGQLNTFKVVGAIPGDIQLRVGMIIGLVVPKMQIQNRMTANDPYRTGRYLVSSIHHKFIIDTAATIVELLSDSVAQALPQSSPGSPSLQQIVKS
jgi:hypothetical protein